MHGREWESWFHRLPTRSSRDNTDPRSRVLVKLREYNPRLFSESIVLLVAFLFDRGIGKRFYRLVEHGPEPDVWEAF